MDGITAERVSELRFLVVEGHGFQRWILSSILETMGAKFVYSAADGIEALAILEDREPPIDIIITDLARVPFTELKIDRTFVTNAGYRGPGCAMPESSLEAAQRLGIHSVAEGVEKRAQWDLVRSLKCDLAQGYFVARPMEAGEILGWAQARWRASA